MSKSEKNTFFAVAAGANYLISKSYEAVLLAITAGYFVGKEAGHREAQAVRTLLW